MQFSFEIALIDPKIASFRYPQSLLKEIVIAALGKWANASNLIFVESAKLEGIHHLLFKVVDHEAQLDSPNIDVFAMTKFLHNSDVEIWINGNHNWSNIGPEQSSKSGIDLLTVLLHEIGHALGLDHDENNQTSVMYFEYTGLKHCLATRDTKAVCSEFGPVRGNFAINNPTNERIPGRYVQFLAIGLDQYLFFSEKPNQVHGVRKLKALRSRNLRVWERLELPEMDKQNFWGHLHLVKLSRRLLITKQGFDQSHSRMAVIPISWHSPMFNKCAFDEVTNLKLSKTQAIGFDNNLIILGIDGNELKTNTIHKKSPGRPPEKMVGEWEFDKPQPWKPLDFSEEYFKLVGTFNRVFLFSMDKDGQLSWRFNETGTSWSPQVNYPNISKVQTFDAAAFGDLIYVAHISEIDKMSATVRVRTWRVDDSEDSKLAEENAVQVYLLDLAGVDDNVPLSLTIVYQNARMTLALENDNKIFFQEI